MGLTVSGKSVFPTSFGRDRLQGNLFSFEKHKWLQKILFDVICLEIRHNGVAFFLNELKMQLLEFSHYLVLDLVPWEQVFEFNDPKIYSSF